QIASSSVVLPLPVLPMSTPYAPVGTSIETFSNEKAPWYTAIPESEIMAALPRLQQPAAAQAEDAGQDQHDHGRHHHGQGNRRGGLDVAGAQLEKYGRRQDLRSQSR